MSNPQSDLQSSEVSSDLGHSVGCSISSVVHFSSCNELSSMNSKTPQKRVSKLEPFLKFVSPTKKRNSLNLQQSKSIS